MKQSKRRTLKASEVEEYEKSLLWAKRCGNVANGLYFDDPLAGRDGIQVIFFVPPGTDNDAIEKAKRIVINERDVVHFTILDIPAAFIKETASA